MASPQKENGYTPISNEIMEAFAKFRIPGEARQMLDIIIRKTYGYGKKKDPISTSQFIELTGLKRFIIHRARKRLLLANLITVSKNDNSQILSYSFQKDYEKWTTVIKNAQCAKKVSNCKQKRSQTVTNIDDHKRNKDNITIYISNTTAAKNYFYTSYKQAFGQDYIADFGKDGKIFKNLTAIIPLEELKSLIDKFFTSDDKFVKESGYTTVIFKSQINKLRAVREKCPPSNEDKEIQRLRCIK